MDMLANGQIDLLIGMNQRPERDKYALFSLPFAEERIRLWGRKGETRQYEGMSLQQLVAKNVRIFAPDAGWYGPEFQKLKDNKAPQITFYKDFKRGLALLHRGRNNLVLGSENFAQYLPEQYKDISVMLPQVLHTDYLRLMYSKKTVTPEVVQLIDKAIKDELGGKYIY
jgi:ABC-type amino acid transport substrate-binding protein